MRYEPIDPRLVSVHRQSWRELLLPNSVAIVNSNDLLPTNADGTFAFCQSADLFYLTGIEQEEAVLMMYPDAHEERYREVLFLREPDALRETWEGHKLTKAEAKKISGIERVEWLSDFRSILHRVMCESEHVYLNSNEHKRGTIVWETLEPRFFRQLRQHYPLHHYHHL